MTKTTSLQPVFLLATMGLLGSVNAQDTTQLTLNNVVVTAQKTAFKQAQTGKVVTVITRQQIERAGGKDVSQLLNEQSGLIINGANSNPGKDKSVYLRGAKNDYTLILVNGIPVYDPSSTGGAFDLRLLPIDQIERIEIVKGAQSTLYGSDAIAGVINIITRQAQPGLQANVVAAYGSYNTKRLSTSVQGGSARLQFNAGYNHLSTDGISEALAPSSATTPFDKDGMVSNAYNVGIHAQITQKWQAAPFFRHTHINSRYDDGAFADGDNRYTSNVYSAGIINTIQTARGKIVAQYTNDNTKRIFDSQFDYAAKGKNQIAEVFTSQQITQQLQLLGGVEFRWLENLPIDNGNSTKTYAHQYAPYINAVWQATNFIHLEGGLRYVTHSQFGNAMVYSFNPSIQLGKNQRLFVNVGKAFKAPTLDMLFGAFGANPTLTPEKGNTYEAGLQSTWFNKALETRVTGFIRDIDDVIIYRSPQGYANFDRQYDKGVEFEAIAKLHRSFQITANYTFLDGKLETQRNNKDTSFNNLIRRPKHSFNLSANWMPNTAWTITLSTQHQGERTDLDFSTWPASNATLPAFSLWNIYIGYAFPKHGLQCFADARNIFDKDYQEIVGYSTQGFNLQGGIRYTIQKKQHGK